MSEVGAAALELTAALIGIDSQNPTLVPGAAGEGPIVSWLADRLADRGFEVELVRPAQAPDRPSLLARLPGRGDGPSLVLNGHLDTVGVGAMVDPFAPRIEGDRLYGRGACDMKAGAAAMVAVAEHRAEHPAGRDGAEAPWGDLWLALVADEEDASLGTEAVIERFASLGVRPDACLVGEPTWLDLVAAHRGFAVVEVTLTGRAAHSSRPADGVNAVTHLGRLLGAVEAADDRLRARPGHPLTGVGSLMATVARGGEAPFSLAAAATVVIERRTTPDESAAQAVAEVQAILDELHAADGTVTGRCRLVLARDPWQRSDREGANRLSELLAAGLTTRGRSPAVVGEPYWMESPLWEAAGIPAVVCGPAGGGLHTDEEWVEISQLTDYAEALEHAVRAFCVFGAG